MTFPITSAEAFTDPDLFGPHFAGDTWKPWSAFLATLGGEAATLPPDLAALASSCTERTDLATTPAFRELWCIAGRRSGKTRIAAMLATWAACFVDWRAHLAPGELATVAVIAADRSQAKVAFRYIRALVAETPPLRRMIVAETADRLELNNRAAVEVMTSSAVSVRGRSLACAILDEIAFWPTGDAADPDHEVLTAIRPALASLPGSFLLAISSPYARRGELWNAYRHHFGRDGSRVLVWRAPTLTMNPTIAPELVAQALAEDPERASAEWQATFRSDLAAFVDKAVLEGAVVPGRRELLPAIGERYFGFVDPSGGTSDSFTLAIAHHEDGTAVLDCLRERRPPFSPDAVCAEFAGVLKRYEIARVVADKYAGAWVVDSFARHGITLEQSAKPKSELYGELLPALNSGKVTLLDDPRLIVQLAALERRTARGGRDIVDHPPNAHDDLANSAAGALVAALKREIVVDMSQAFMVPLRTASIGDDWSGFTPSAPASLSVWDQHLQPRRKWERDLEY